ncbi:MAG: pyrroline-5-carboxylate reductase [Planctomycetes bacterium]|nr:pyrroline-5-carboxylate reductase [Planctomycetota bacterium]
MPVQGTVGILGAGNIGLALLRGWIASGAVPRASLIASAKRPERLEQIARELGVEVTTDNAELARRSDILVLSVKPQILDRVLDQIADSVRLETLVVSIAAGVPISAIERRLGHETRIVRVMPNTPTLVGLGAAALAAGAHATDGDIAVVRELFEAVGVAAIVDESLLDAVTGLSGSGPAYVFLILEAFSDAGVKVGLDRETAQKLATQTLLGSAKLLLTTGEHPGRLKDMVTSPGGTAIAGLHTLEAGGLRTTIMDAVEAATRRSRELGRSFGADEG